MSEDKVFTRKTNLSKVQTATDKLNPRQRRFLANYFKTGNAMQSARVAGYKCLDVTPYKVLGSDRFQDAYQALLDHNGISDKKLIEVLKDGLAANKVISAVVVKSKHSSDVHNVDADDGSHDFIEVPDHSTRHKFLETGLKLKKRLGEKEAVEGNQIINPIINVIRFKDDGCQAQEVSGRVRVHRCAVPGDGVSVGDGQELVRDIENTAVV